MAVALDNFGGEIVSFLGTVSSEALALSVTSSVEGCFESVSLATLGAVVGREAILLVFAVGGREPFTAVEGLDEIEALVGFDVTFTAFLVVFSDLGNSHCSTSAE